MKRTAVFSATLAGLTVLGAAAYTKTDATNRTVTITRSAVRRDVSPPLDTLGQPSNAAQFIPDKPVVIQPAVESTAERMGSVEGPGTGLGNQPPSPPPARGARAGAGRGARGRGARPTPPPPVIPTPPDISAAGAAVEQTQQGPRPALVPVASFDGLGNGFVGIPEDEAEPPAADAQAQGFGRGGPRGARGGIDISLAVGPDHIVEILDGNMAVFTKKGKKYPTTGKLLYGAVPNDTVFAGFGNRCANNYNSDSVVRYDQLADRWLIVVPIFQRGDDPAEPYGMCYAVSATSDPLGSYYRYEFARTLFPDYPRPAIWTDGYYLPTSTSDNLLPDVITQKHDCIADRSSMLKGEPASEQCVVIDGAVFMLNADIDGKALPPKGAPNIMMSTGGTQLLKIFDSDGIYYYKVHVDWKDPSRTTVSEPQKITVAPYHYLCDGQLSDCVPQPDTDKRLDAQGDKLMQRMVYRNIDGHQSIVAEHSIYTAAHAGGVRWYEFRLDKEGNPELYQQGTYAPDDHYRWLGSMDMDKKGDIAIGYSYGGTPAYPGQRFAARMPGDALGKLTFHESVIAEGAASDGAPGASGTQRWEDYTQMSMDPSDDCTFWFVGNYLKAGATSSTTRIAAFVVPGCK